MFVLLNLILTIFNNRTHIKSLFMLIKSFHHSKNSSISLFFFGHWEYNDKLTILSDIDPSFTYQSLPPPQGYYQQQQQKKANANFTKLAIYLCFVHQNAPKIEVNKWLLCLFYIMFGVVTFDEPNSKVWSSSFLYVWVLPIKTRSVSLNNWIK